MKLNTIGAALGLLAVQPCSATRGHRHLHKRDHGHNHSAREAEAVEHRSLATCSFPSGKGLVAITPGSVNGGWALSPDQKCSCGSYCPYACPPGQVMAQWKPGSNYGSTDRMDGGLFCELDGTLSKPFDDKPYCVDGTGTVQAVNKAGSVVSFCQTVLPGNEDIIIPTDVYDTTTLAVPDHSYWDSTAAHYYINAPGVSSDEGCHWGDSSKPLGNWAPYVAGANTDSSGDTFVKLGLNPIWQSSSLFSTKPSFAMNIDCPSGNCVGMPCSVDGNGVTSDEKATGAGGSDFCVVTVPSGSSANIVVHNLDGSSGESSSSAPEPTSSAVAPTTSSEPEPEPEPTTSEEPTTTTPSVVSTTTSLSSTVVSTTTSSEESSIVSSTTTSSIASSSSSASPTSYHLGGIFQENGTAAQSSFSWAGAAASAVPTAISNSAGEAPAPSASTKNDGVSPVQNNGAIVGLIVAFIATACLI